MTSPPENEPFDELTLRVLHGVADNADKESLCRSLRVSEESRRRFIAHATQHAMLCREGAAGALAADQRLYFERLEDKGRGWTHRAWIAATAVAAVVLAAGVLFRPTAAMAALEKVVQVAQGTLSRCYSVRVLEPGLAEEPRQGRGPYPPANHLEGAMLWMRGPGEFVLQQRLPNGEIRMLGSNHGGSWTMRGSGPVKVSPDPNRFGRAVFTPSGELASLDLRTQLGQLTKNHDLEWVDDKSPGIRKLRALRQRQAQGGPKEVELWFEPATGVVERMVLRHLPRGNGGPRSLELVLVSAEPLPDAFFRHDSHHEPGRAVLLEP